MARLREPNPLPIDQFLLLVEAIRSGRTIITPTARIFLTDDRWLMVQWASGSSGQYQDWIRAIHKLYRENKLVGATIAA
jgi:hypothetical protein